MAGNSYISVWILGDQLSPNNPALIAARKMADQSRIWIVLIESQKRLTKIPYHRKKLVLLLSAMRHYADTLSAAGYQVDYMRANSTLDGLKQHVQKRQPERIVTMAAAEYSGRHFQKEKLEQTLGIPTLIVPNTQFLVGRHDPYATDTSGKRVIMENFYRSMRRHFDVLMEEDGQPSGDQWNFDKDNRKPLPKKGLDARSPVVFEQDEITTEVVEFVDSLKHGVGETTGFNLAVDHEQVQTAIDDFIDHRLPQFGAYEDAMSQEDGVLFHSVLSPYLNIGLIDPLDIVRRVESAYRDNLAPINSVEGFIRQVLGWREYIYWQYWQQMPELMSANHWCHNRSMPLLFWNAQTDMNCLHHVVKRVIDSGYSHHIERLMLICNFCMLTGIDPAAVNEWFLSFYVDAYEWVVTPNVIGMGLNADGGKTATKPYIASANYVNKMGNYCTGCQYNQKQRTGKDACPFNFLYWNFLVEHEEELRANPRFGPAVLGLRHLDQDERGDVQHQAKKFVEQLNYYDRS